MQIIGRIWCLFRYIFPWQGVTIHCNRAWILGRTIPRFLLHSAHNPKMLGWPHRNVKPVRPYLVSNR